jgi:RNA polymerase sigma-70 factor, ECF subfamily
MTPASYGIEIGAGSLDGVGSAGTAQTQPPFDAFVAEHRDRAVALAWRLIGGDRAAAEDITQEAFLRAYRSLHRFRGEAKLSTWFYRILVNEVKRYQRWRWVRQRRAGESVEEPPDPRPMAGDPALRQRVAGAMAQLSHGQREAFVLVHLEGFSVREAAQLTGRANGTIKSHLHRALRRLREQLADLDPSREPAP